MALHARVYDLLCGHLDNIGLRRWRKVLVGDLAGTIVELGCGTGKNLPLYGAGATVFASDFDSVMLQRAVARASASPAQVRLFLADAMRLPLADASVDTVVVGLVLCSVPDADRAVEEVKRVLKPGGSLRFVEHVRDTEGSFRAKLQDAVNPAWRLLSGGCNANRRTPERVESHGFALEQLYRFRLGHTHIAPHAMGVARRA